MTRTIRPSELHTVLCDVVRLSIRQRDDAPTVIARCRAWIRGTSAGGGGPAPKGTVSDPTGTTAARNADGAGDPHASLRARYEGHLLAAYAELKGAERIRSEVMAPPPSLEEIERQGRNQRADGVQPCCNPHGCPDDALASKAGRCEACYRRLRRTGRDRRLSGAK